MSFQIRHGMLVMLALALSACTAGVPGVAGSGGASASGNNSGGASAGTSVSATTHTESISASEIWKKGVHVVDGHISVSGDNAPVLTIEPGCVVKFTPGSSLTISGNGGLIAQGTASAPITFTSANASPNKGDWEGLDILDANSSQTKLAYCTVEYAGDKGDSWDRDHGYGIYVGADNIQPTFDHVTVSKSAGYGFEFSGTGAMPATFTNNTATGCGYYPVKINAAAAGALGTGNTWTGNDTDVVEIDGDIVGKSATWQKQDVPFRVQDEVTIQGDTAPTLTLQPGSVFQMAQGAEFYVGDSGGLLAAGTADAPIAFQSLPNATNPGEWAGLAFSAKANASQCKIDHVTIDDAGGDRHECCDKGAIYTELVFPITNTKITNSAAWGIFPSGVSLTLGADVTYSNNASGNLSTPSS